MDVNALRVLNFGDQVLPFVRGHQYVEFFQDVVLDTVRDPLPDATLDTLTGDAVASSKASISIDGYARGHLQNG